MTPAKHRPTLSPTQLLGFALWRSGLLILGAYSAYRGARLALRWIDLPPVLDVGLALVIAGAVLVLVSLVLERVADAREEGDLAP